MMTAARRRIRGDPPGLAGRQDVASLGSTAGETRRHVGHSVFSWTLKRRSERVDAPD